jgi:hypothetical protein
MQMFAGFNAADQIDVTTLEGRTAAMQRMAMLQERIRHLSAAAMRARAMGRSAEALRCQHEAQELGVRIRHMEMCLSTGSPLAGFSGYGAAPAYAKSADAELAAKQTALDKATEGVQGIDKSIKRLINEIDDRRKQLDRAGALDLGKKSYLKGEIDEREKSIASLRERRKGALKKQEDAKKELEKATALARAPGQVAARLDATIEDLRKSEASYTSKNAGLDKQIRDLKSDLDKAGVLSLAKKNYIKDEIARLERLRGDNLKALEKIREKIRDLSGELGKAKAYAQAKQGKPAAMQQVQVVKAGMKQEVVRQAGALPVRSIADKVRVDGMNKQIGAETADLRELNEKIRSGMKSGKDVKALLILIDKARSKADTIRDVTFKRDSITLGAAGARAARARGDQNRVIGTELELQSIKTSGLPALGRGVVTKKLEEHLKSARAALAQSQKEIASVAAGRVKTLPKLRSVNPSVLTNQKRQLALKPNAPQPTADMMVLLSQAFAQAVPPIKGEKPEDYVLRLKRYIARGAIVAANTQADGKPPVEAVKAAVKDVVVQDAPAIEEEARMKVTAPAGEEAVATAVNAAEATIVQAAVAAAPEAMAEAAPPSEQAAADIIATPAEANAEAAPVAEVIEKITDVTVPGAETTAVATTDTEASRVDDGEVTPWYRRPSGMILIGVGALIGIRALTSKE